MLGATNMERLLSTIRHIFVIPFACLEATLHNQFTSISTVTQSLAILCLMVQKTKTVDDLSTSCRFSSCILYRIYHSPSKATLCLRCKWLSWNTQNKKSYTNQQLIKRGHHKSETYRLCKEANLDRLQSAATKTAKTECTKCHLSTKSFPGHVTPLKKKQAQIGWQKELVPGEAKVAHKLLQCFQAKMIIPVYVVITA